MPNEADLLKKLFAKPFPHNFNIRELDTLMRKCGCKKYSGGRGSSIQFIHQESGRILQFDGPHPGKELYRYQIEKTRRFLVEIGEV